MSLLSRLRPVPRPAEPVDHDSDLLPELNDPHWLHHATAFAHTSFWAVARRLPGIIREALQLALTANRRDTVAAISLNVVAGVMTTFGLLATGSVLAELFAEGPTPDRVRAALPALLAAATAVLLRGGLGIAAGWAQARLSPQINYAVELRLFEATTAVDLAAFDDAGFGEEMDRAQQRGMAEAASIVDSSVNLLTGLVGVTATAAAVVLIQPVLLPCLLLAAVPTAVTAIRMARREYLTMLIRINRRRRMWLLAGLMANRHTALEIRVYQMRAYLLDEYRRIMRLETATMLNLARRQSISRLNGALLGGLAAGALYVVLGWLLLGGAVPLGAAATAIVALQTAQSGLRVAVQATNRLYESALYYTDFRDFLRRAAGHIPNPGGAPVDGFDEIRVEAVSLHYPDTEQPAVDEVSLTLRRGEVVAFVGENGSGKTSLAKLIAGLYRPTAGHIRWDGVDTAGIDRISLAAQVGVLSQDWYKFPFTVRQNIAVGRYDRATESAVDGAPSVVEAARSAAAAEMIDKLPRQYETLLDREFKDGHELSGGQWQRLVAARGFYRHARLLICDEPSAALDARAEHTLFEQLRRRPDRTVVLITHRLANVRHADRVYVLHEGRLVEEGTHVELMAAHGRYAELFALQASGYLDGAG